MNTLNTLGSGQILFLSIIIIAISFFLLILVFTNTRKKTIRASDGSLFKDVEELDRYETLLNKIEPLYQDESSERKANLILGLELTFIESLRKGFYNKKKLISYKDQFRILSELLKT